MRPLNRPMFRYGGPIKEGIMSGIKEPRQNYNRAGKVLKYLPGGQKLVNKISTSTKDIIPRTIQKVKNFYSGDPSRYGVPAAEGIKQKALRFLKPDEKAGLLTNKYIFDRTVVPVAGGAKFAFQKAAPYATAGGLTLGGGYALFGGDDKPNINKTGGPEGPPSIMNPPGGKKDDTGTPPPGVQLTEKEKRAQQIEKYRDIMDIKGMNKAAAYDCLIAASQAVNQAGGDLKGAIRDGSLINQIIQSTSKAFDKPKKTKDAIDTLILKGEIQSDIAAGKPSAIEQQINAISKNLKVDKETATKMFLKQPTDLRSQVTEDASLMKSIPTHSIIASATKKQYPNAEILLSDTEVKEKYGDKMSGEDIIKSLDIFKTAKDPSGIYVVGKEVIQIDKQGNTNTIFP